MAQNIEHTVERRVGQRSRRLLLAEDNAASRDSLGALLNRANYQVDFAENGLRAVEMWQQRAYDLVLMDIQMPFWDGFEATGAIREQERESGLRTPIVAMTAYTQKEDEERFLAGGMDAYIAKPVDFRQTLQLIESILERNSGGARGTARS